MHSKDQQFTVIDVPWDMEWKEVESHRGEIIELLVQQNRIINMPWLDFLFEHAQKIETDKYYNPAAMLYRLNFRFYLVHSDATMYNLKYR